MKLFLDTAHVPTIEKWITTGLIDGVTTNPTNLSAEGTNPKATILALAALLPNGELSVEVTMEKPDDVYKQAKALVSLSKNIVVKIPCHLEYYPVIKQLVHEKIPLNITLVFSLVQGCMMAKLGVRYVSPFVGRLDDIGGDGIALLEQLRQMLDTYESETQILAASLRSVAHMQDAILAGVNVATVAPDILQTATQHPLTRNGMAKFSADWQKLNITQFP